MGLACLGQSVARAGKLRGDLGAVVLQALPAQLSLVQPCLRSTQLYSQFAVFTLGILNLALRLSARVFGLQRLRAQGIARTFSGLQHGFGGRAIAAQGLEALRALQHPGVRINPTAQAQPVASHPFASRRNQRFSRRQLPSPLQRLGQRVAGTHRSQHGQRGPGAAYP